MALIIPLNSEEGQQMLKQVKQKGWPYQPHVHSIFGKQVGRANCGIQSCALLMSAAHLGNTPEGDTIDTDNLPYTEAGMFTFQATLAVANAKKVSQDGLTLDEVVTILENHGLKVDKYFANETSVEHFRETARCSLENKKSKCGVIVNYHMSTLGQVPFGGHHSPLAGYHEDSDRFLLLDTWPDTPVSWVTPADLFTAMDTLDDASDKKRGFCIVHFD